MLRKISRFVSFIYDRLRGEVVQNVKFTMEDLRSRSNIYATFTFCTNSRNHKYSQHVNSREIHYLPKISDVEISDV